MKLTSEPVSGDPMIEIDCGNGHVALLVHKQCGGTSLYHVPNSANTGFIEVTIHTHDDAELLLHLDQIRAKATDGQRRN